MIRRHASKPCCGCIPPNKVDILDLHIPNLTSISKEHKKVHQKHKQTHTLPFQINYLKFSSSRRSMYASRSGGGASWPAPGR